MNILFFLLLLEKCNPGLAINGSSGNRRWDIYDSFMLAAMNMITQPVIKIMPPSKNIHQKAGT